MEKLFSFQKEPSLIRVYIFCLFFAFSSIHAEGICTISSPTQLTTYIRENVQKGTLLVLDIDDTLIIAQDPLLRGSQLDRLLSEIKRRLNLSQEEVLGFLELSLESKNSRLGKGLLVFPEWPSLIEDCFINSAKVIALTHVASGAKTIHLSSMGIHCTQSMKGEDRRLEDLQSVGLNFERSFVQEMGFDSTVLANHSFLSSNRSPPLFKRGIICTNLHPKGEALAAFLQRINWKPIKVVFIDNLENHLYSVQKEMKKLSIPFDGVHFTFVEDHYCNLDDLALQGRLDMFFAEETIKKLSPPLNQNLSPNK